MKNKNHRSGLPNPRSRYFRSRPRGAILTAEADLSPDRSPPKNPSLTISEIEVAQIPPPPPSPVPDLPHADPQSPKAHLSGDDLRPWVKLRQRRLPHYFYRRLPNWFYPDKSTHEPYTPWLYNKRRATPDGVVATGGPQPGASEMELPEEEPPEEEEEEEEERYPAWW